MPIFIEIGPRTCKLSRFESNIPENESHKFTIFQTNQNGERKKNTISILLMYIATFNYKTFHFKSTRKSSRILQNNIFE